MLIPGDRVLKMLLAPKGQNEQEERAGLPVQPPLQGGISKEQLSPWGAACGFPHGYSTTLSTNANRKRGEQTYQAPPVVDRPEKKRIRFWPAWVAFMLLSSIIRSIDSNNSASSIQLDRFPEVSQQYQEIERRGENSRFIDSLRKLDSTAKPKSYFRKKEDMLYPEFNQTTNMNEDSR
ncbi:MAG: hypothetical protein H6616_02775 [Ignavibacteria bacterium]|nr:hypothetical protein [Ignavibacteria bacterium]